MKLCRVTREPILTSTNNPWENKWVFNCAATIYKGQIYLLYRAQGDDNISRFGIARLSNPKTVVERAKNPIFAPDPDNQYESLGVEDPRITRIGDTYYIVYVAASYYPPLVDHSDHKRSEQWRVRVSLAKTRDFESFTRYGVIIEHIDSKDAALFPEKIAGQYLLVHRVIPHLRLATSPSGTEDYSERGPIYGPRDEDIWDNFRIGLGAQPIKTPFGWLLFYHGVDKQKVYRLGAMLLDNHDPSIVLHTTPEPILEPEEPWEREGLATNVVFTCGAVEYGDSYYVYYGAADSVIGVASIEKHYVYDWAQNISERARQHRIIKTPPPPTEETQERKQKEGRAPFTPFRALFNKLRRRTSSR